MQNLKKQELVDTAKAMIDGRMDLIVGIRAICSLRFAVGAPDDEIFFPIRGIESETDVFPVGELRKSYNQEYLARVDIEMSDYLKEAESDILDACKEIIKKFS